MIHRLSTILVLFSAMLYVNARAATLLVPSQCNSIQSAIDASTDGDTILVSPGVYNEAISFKGKAIVVKGMDGPEVTRIDAPALYAVTFDSGEDSLSILSGFSIGPEEANVHSTWNGILCSSSSPTIVGNIVERLKRAIMVVKGSPIIKRNIIREGIWFENTSGIFTADTCSPVIVNNIIFGYYQGIRISGSTPAILFNTLDQNKYGIFGADSCIIKNNIITNGSYGIFAVTSPRVILSHNNIWNNGIQSFDLNYQNCSPGEGDISADPMFTVSPPFRLQEDSPCIDAGVDVGVYEDFDGNSRSAGAGYDIGAFEYGSAGVVLETETVTPNTFSLEQNYPNPFNPMTVIRYQLPKQAVVRLEIYNIVGELVNTLVNETQPAGYHTVRWNGRDEHGRTVASGVYLYSLKASEFMQTRKMILIR